jgi:threonine synthase
MQFISTKNPNEKVSFKTAVIQGLAKNKALFMPEFIPQLSKAFIDNLPHLTKTEIGIEVMRHFVSDDITLTQLEKIVEETLAFDIPTKHLTKNTYVLELFHGPTKAFKDVGARFMSRCLSHFVGQENKVTVLVATSGDTGSAVAHGFFDVPGIDVCILFPKGKVSAYQEYQMTSLGKNIKTIEIDGTFDDCQALVKEAFSDAELNEIMNLSSANSINVARLLPQIMYYFLSYKDMIQKTNKPLVYCVPSGNLGNITAGVIAKKMGLPIHRFIAAENANDTFVDYLETGHYKPKRTVATFSNAMDVSDPSNFERLAYLYPNRADMLEIISGMRISDEETIEEIKTCFAETTYTLDPHGAVGKMALERLLKPEEVGVFLETAHPTKFESVVQKALPEFKPVAVDLSTCQKTSMANDYGQFKSFLADI